MKTVLSIVTALLLPLAAFAQSPAPTVPPLNPSPSVQAATIASYLLSLGNTVTTASANLAAMSPTMQAQTYAAIRFAYLNQVVALAKLPTWQMVACDSANLQVSNGVLTYGPVASHYAAPLPPGNAPRLRIVSIKNGIATLQPVNFTVQVPVDSIAGLVDFLVGQAQANAAAPTPTPAP